MSDELKPCAHCGGVGEKEQWSHVNWDEWRIFCGRCGTSSDWYASLTAAIAAWNRRADDAQVIQNAESYKLADDSRSQVIPDGEKYELADSREIINAIRARFGAGPTTMTDEQIAAGREVYGAKHDYDIAVYDELQDTREKLEADAKTLLFEFGHYCATSREGLSDDVYVFIGDLTDLLDRQAAITRKECSPEAIDYMLNTIGELEERVDELTAELDACRMRERAAEDYDFREAAERWEQAYEDKCGDVASLTAERDQLSHDLDAEHALVVQFEYDNAKANDTINTLRASVAGLKDTVEKLRARNE